ncbi:MAG: hypothetical protein ACPL4K_04080 [Candidatus Margulisiibacteriota bacterium]
MRRTVALLMLVLMLTPMVFAQAKKTAPAKEIVETTSFSASQGFVGVSLNQIPVLPWVAPSARFGFGGWSLDVGGSLVNDGTGTATTLFGRAEIPISEVSKNIRTYSALILALFSPAGGGSTTTDISICLGAEYVFAPKLSLFADLIALNLTSSAGTTTWTISSNSPTIYSGARLYF